MSSGRVMLRRKDHPHCNDWGYVYRYRLVVEESIGRFLTPDEIIHHKNGDETDDRLENLELTNQRQHSKLHYLTRKLNKKGQLT